MKILFITIAFAPNEFSEGIVNSKLVLALQNRGHQVDVISRSNHSVTYSNTWNKPWQPLKKNTHEIDYPIGSKFERFIDTLSCSLQFQYPLEGVRWVKRAFNKAEELIKKNNYDFVLTRSPSEIPHLVGLKIKKKYKLKWIANFNDPTNGIMPLPYKNNGSFLNIFLSKFYTQKYLKSADFLSFPSERLRDYFINKFKFNKEKTIIIPHISLDIININSNKSKDSILSICHAGSLSIERDAKNLLKCIQKIKKENNTVHIQFSILGIADKYFIDLIEKYDLSDNVSFIESKTYLDSLRYMIDYDVLCIIEAKMEEGVFLPSKFSDYFSINKPILCISPSKGTLSDIIVEYGGGVVLDNENMEKMYNGLQFLINQKEKNILNNLTSSNLKKILSKDAILNQYDNLFIKLKKC